MTKRIFWHKDLPPTDADPQTDNVVEALSQRVPTKASSTPGEDSRWEQCHTTLLKETEARLLQELDRLGGRYAHIIGEAIEEKTDPVTSEYWLHGRFDYVWYR